MTVRYETLLLATPEITAQETSSLEEQIERLVKKYEGSVGSFEKWGKYRLAYQVRKNEYGVYFLTRFDVDRTKAQALLLDLHNLFSVKLAPFIMRHLNQHLPLDVALAYQRPESLEETPSQDIDNLLR